MELCVSALAFKLNLGGRKKEREGGKTRGEGRKEKEGRGRRRGREGKSEERRRDERRQEGKGRKESVSPHN